MRAAVLPLVPAWRVDRTFDYAVPVKLASDVVPGTLVRIPFGGRVVRGIVREISGGGAENLEEVKGIVVRPPLVPPPMDDVMDAIARRYVVPRGKAFARVVPPRVRVASEPPERSGRTVPPDTLLAYRGGSDLLSALQASRPGAWCIEVLPGEDRGRLVAELVSAASGAALVTVPEVRYGSNVLDRVAALLPDLVRVDSATSDRDRSAAWLAMASGHGLAGGGRGAALTPSPGLGLVIVDEEHHQTYKEDRAPRYDARWVALRRARAQGALCVLMSASPSVETGSAAADGRFGSVAPGRDQSRRARPLVELVDIEPDRAVGHNLHQRIGRTLRDGGRVALLAPSPAFARAMWCGGCRRSLRCPRCEAGLFFDRGAVRVRCARCGFAGSPPETCPTCGASEFRYVGAGTERLAEQLSRSFPRARVVRVDPAAPEEAAAGEADVYVTTWRGTKPELRPDAALVGVLDADWLIRRPDFRAAESAYQAMVEMSEWAGPAAGGGRLVIQTAEAAHHSLQAIVRADYSFFLRKELEQRRELLYPPFVELIKVRVSGPGARRVVGDLVERVTPLAQRVLGPVEVMVRGRDAALQVLVKCASAEPVADELRVILEGAPKGVRLMVDVDPR